MNCEVFAAARETARKAIVFTSPISELSVGFFQPKKRLRVSEFGQLRHHVTIVASHMYFQTHERMTFNFGGRARREGGRVTASAR